ncbi:clusterin-like protein 1 isoform X1 [Clupea harengus]|uniref:Clusterin n=2 Tax=Clupea harengus TaxID=7950 RepID=A0A6P8F3V6_CLUHA|nr:clusterin-like protein 1 isoform X1 [Clupea harengus]
MTMRALAVSLVLMASLGVFHCAREGPIMDISEETLKQLSLEGEKYVDEAVRKALYGVKQMKDIMAKNEEKHEHLMKSLKHSSDKKKGAEELVEEVEHKLGEVEKRCRDSVQAFWEECRPCLEKECKAFYTKTCRRSFSAFTNRVGNFFHRVTSHLGPQGSEEQLGQNQTAESSEQDAVRIEDSFGMLLSKVGTLVNRCVVLASRMQHKLDRNLRKTYDPALQDREAEIVLPSPDRDLDSGFLKGVGLEEVMESFFDFGRSVVEEFGAVLTQVFDDMGDAADEERKREKELFPRFLQNRKLCRALRRHSSECWQLQHKCEPCQGTMLSECPNVRELHIELGEVSELLEVSKQQYEEVLEIVQRHTDDTVSWLGNMATEFDWVAELANNNSAPESIFSITTVEMHNDEGVIVSGGKTKVEVSILSSPMLTLTVPGELELQDPAFVQYVAEEALGLYKQRVRHEDN